MLKKVLFLSFLTNLLYITGCFEPSTHSEKESVQKMFDFMREENVAKFIKTYVDEIQK